MYYFQSGKDLIVELLIKAGADVNKKDGYTRNMPLGDAIVVGHGKVVEILINNGADVNLAYGHDDHTALHTSITWSRENIVCW